MIRRVHVPFIQTGETDLSPEESRHLRDVLRLEVGQAVEAFDASGQTAQATITSLTPHVRISIETITPAVARGLRWTIASAVPKAARADWMVEKLCELGTTAWIPLHADRSVAIPSGEGKLSRWARLAQEAAKQSRRTGVMRIEPICTVDDLLESSKMLTWHLSTSPDAVALGTQLPIPVEDLLVLVGPEGGWTEREISVFDRHLAKGISLTSTILRIETAAVAVSAIIGSLCR